MSSFLLSILELFEIDTDEVIVHFVSEEKISFLHGMYFNDPSTTDCISFPIDGTEKRENDSAHILGECFINPTEAINYCKEKPYEELSRYVIHCVLHFIGYLDSTDEEKAEMRSLEDKALEYAKKKKVLLCNPDPLYR